MPVKKDTSYQKKLEGELYDIKNHIKANDHSFDITLQSLQEFDNMLEESE